MSDSRDRDSGHERSGGRSGPEGSHFLDLEITRMLYGQAEKIAMEAARDIVKEAITARLRERMGDELEAIAVVAADAIADDFEANRRIEEVLEARRDERRDLKQRIHEAVRESRGGKSKKKSKKK